jgi:hypothetical protein
VEEKRTVFTGSHPTASRLPANIHLPVFIPDQQLSGSKHHFV